MTENMIMMDRQSDEVLVDLFCGAGGSGGGLLAACDALGRDVRGHFVNHWEKAIDIHEANHPEHEHYPEDLFLLDPAAIFPPDTYCSLLWGSPACFTGNAMVLSEKGYRSIADIRVGDRVLTHGGRWKPVVATFKKQAPTILLKGQGHYGLETTKEHPFYSKRITKRYPGRRKETGKRPSALRIMVENPHWPKAEDMPGKLWATPHRVDGIPVPMDHGMLMDEHLCYMFGRWLGDGCASKGDLSICCGYHEVAELRSKLSRVNDEDNNSLVWREHAGATAFRFDLGAARLVRFMTREFGKGAAGKHVAPWVFGLPRAWRKALLQGYLDADGHTPVAGRCSCGTISKALALGVKLLLSEEFAVSMHEAVSRPTHIEGRPVKGGTLTYILAWQPSNLKETSFVDSNHRFTFCRSAKSGKDSDLVYNIQVADDESYVVDGIVVHNCTFFSLARGAACVNEQDRSHAHSITDWVKHLQPEGVIIENVREFRDWGRLMQKRNAKGELMWALKAREVKKLPEHHQRGDGETEEDWGERMLALGYSRYEVPDKRHKGEYFKAWLQEMSDLGYDHDHRLLRSADYGDPTIRQRLFVYFCRRDSGKKIVWPDPLYDKHGKNGLPKWKSAREHVIDWSIRGTSIFNRKKPMASNTLRRIAIGCVRLGMKDFLLPSNKGWTDNTALRSVEDPMVTITCASRAEGLASAEIACLIPKDQGYQKDYVRSVEGPVSTVQTTAADFLAQASIVQLKGQSTAQSAETPLTSLTTCQSHYLSVPMIDVIRGTGKPDCVSKPLKALTAGGCHEALADALLMTIDQTGGGRNHGCYSVDQPTHTFPTKANASLLELSVEQIERNLVEVCEDRSLDTASVTTFLRHLIAELAAAGRPDVKPWIYVYYSSGAVGSDVDDPVPTIRTKEGTALCFPVIECDGVMLKIDILYRMLKTHELQRAMGFPDDMKWAGATNKEIVKAIGNSVSHGVAMALGLSWYSQKSNIAEYINE